MSAQTFGLAGGSLLDGSFDSANKDIARGAAAAEARTAALLSSCAADGSVILHDLDIPVVFANGGKPNIDHALITGNTIWLIDTKWWSPGFLWTFWTTTRRDWRRFPSAEKQTMVIAREALTRHLTASGVTGMRIRAAVIVWPSNTRRRLSTWAMSFPGARVVHADRANHWVASVTRGNPPADPHAQLALMRLLRHP